MAIFRALTSQGLVDVLSSELNDLDVSVKKKGVNWVEFEANWLGCLRVNSESKIASRVILPVLDFKAFTEDELYNSTLRHDFTQYIDSDQTLSVAASTSFSNIRDQRMVGLKVKDAIVDQFREKTGSRPSIDRLSPDLRIYVRLVHNSVSIAVDTSGRSLSDRGYRIEAGLAPLKENLAAGLLKIAGYTEDVCLLDPMCGSGTFLIEAALMASGRRLRQRPFALQNFKKFRDLKYINETPINKKPLKIFGSDYDIGLIGRAKNNAERAGVSSLIQFARTDFHNLTAPAETGIIIVNPPYGERLLKNENLELLYKDFASVLKKSFKGWTAWLLSGNPELTKALRLKAEKKYLVTNGDIECRFLGYPIT